MLTEADTCRKFAVPKLQAAVKTDFTWNPHSPYPADRDLGDSAFATQEEIDEAGKTTKTEILTAENAETAEEDQALHEEQTAYNASLQPSALGLQPSSFPHCSHHGNVTEIIGKFGGAEQLRTPVRQIQSLLYSA